MTNGRAELALEAAAEATDPALRRLWVVAAVEALLGRRFVIVGGVAVDLHTGSYRPTDIDLIGSLTKAEREVLRDAGFVEHGTRHFAWSHPEGDPVLVEFPSSTLGADYELIELESGVTVAVIDLPGLLIDRLIQATHPSSVSFDDAVALVAAVADEVDWRALADVVRARPDAAYLGLVETTAGVLVRAGLDEQASYFGA